jgi:hypothetical protein
MVVTRVGRVADACGDDRAAATFEASRMQMAAVDALRAGNRDDAGRRFAAAAARSLGGASLEEAISISHIATVSLLRLGETEGALRTAEALVRAIASRDTTDLQERNLALLVQRQLLAQEQILRRELGT